MCNWPQACRGGVGGGGCEVLAGRVLDEEHIVQLRSPYSASAQLAWCSRIPVDSTACDSRLCRPDGHAHAVYGGLDMLLYGAARVITSLDLVPRPSSATLQLRSPGRRHLPVCRSQSRLPGAGTDTQPSTCLPPAPSHNLRS